MSQLPQQNSLSKKRKKKGLQNKPLMRRTGETIKFCPRDRKEVWHDGNIMERIRIIVQEME